MLGYRSFAIWELLISRPLVLRLVLRVHSFTLECLRLVFESEVIRLSFETPLVHDCDTLERHEEVLVLPVDSGFVSTSEVVQVRDLLEDEVDES